MADSMVSPHVHNSIHARVVPPLDGGKVSLRRFPYPYRAALAVCSDIDGTRTLERFLSIQEFLNTTRDTSMGPGIGLEIGNSFFAYTPDDSLAWFSTRPADREMIETLIKAGYIDCLHTYGAGACSRSDALRALEEFERSGCKVDVWVDHSGAPSNLGKDVTLGFGDVVGSPIYHADITLAYGIKFAWMGRTSNIIGHGMPFTFGSFTRILDRNHLGYSVFNIARELAKTMLAHAGNRRFAIHAHNQLLRVACLHDGQRIYEFKRSYNHWRRLPYRLDCHGLAYAIRPKALADLRAAQGYMIIYTHLGADPDRPPFIPLETQAALRGLAQAHRTGEIYVTTTSRLLNYYLNYRHLQWSYEVDNEGRTCITIHAIADPLFGPRLPAAEGLQGITFYVPDRHKTQVYIGDGQLVPIECNPADYTGQESVMIPRTFLTYPLPARYPVTQSVSVPVGDFR